MTFLRSGIVYCVYCEYRLRYFIFFLPFAVNKVMYKGLKKFENAGVSPVWDGAHGLTPQKYAPPPHVTMAINYDRAVSTRTTTFK